MRTRILSFIVMLTVAIAANAAIAQIKAPEAVTSKIVLSVDRLRPGDSFDIAVSATVKKGYHIGANDRDSLYPAKLAVRAPKTVKLESVRYPKAVRKALAFAPGHKVPVYEGTIVMKLTGRVAKDAKPGPVTFSSQLDSQACNESECFPPSISKAQLKTSIVPAGTRVKHVNQKVLAASTKPPRSLVERFGATSAPVRFALLYALGLLLAFTPCVYPMVPVTIGYFSAQHEDKTRMAMLLAGMYVLGIALTYSILGTVAAMTGRVFGELMQSLFVQLGIVAVLVALAASMFGFYELRPPVFVAKHAIGRSGMLGALVMGLIFGVVAAPCVGPVVLGLLLYVARLGKPVTGFTMFFVMSLGLGTPLFALATFSARMPVPGTWMIAVKKIGGFLLLGVAAHFAAAVVPNVIGPYLIPVVLLSGGVYLGFVDDSIRSHKGFAFLSRVGGMAAVLVAIVLAMPHAAKPALAWEPYREAAFAQAVSEHKPVMVDFTARWCGYCRELEHGPFSDPKVRQAAAGFRTLQVDGTDKNNRLTRQAVKTYDIHGFPTVVFFDSSGKEVKSARIVGFVDSAEMVKRMESVR